MSQLTGTEAIDAMKDGWTIVFNQGALLAEMPIEDWLEGFNRADSIVPILDSTLYRRALASDKPRMIRDILAAALVFKNAIKKAQAECEANPERYA